MWHDFGVELVGNNKYDIDEKLPPATGLCEVTAAWNPPDIIDTRISGATNLRGCEDLELTIDCTLKLLAPIAVTLSINPDLNIPSDDDYKVDNTDRVSIPSQDLTDAIHIQLQYQHQVDTTAILLI